MVSVASGMDPPPILWERTYFEDSLSLFYDVRETDDDGFIIAGFRSLGFGHLPDKCVFQTNADGDLLYVVDVGWDYQVAYCVEQLSDGGFIAVGEGKEVSGSSLSLMMLRLDPQGEVLWVKDYGFETSSECGNSVLQLPDGGFLVTGKVNGSGIYVGEAWVLRTDVYGDTLWTDIWGAYTVNYAQRALVVGDSLKVLTYGRIHPDSTRGPHILTYSMEGVRTRETRITSLSDLTAADFCLASDGGYVITTAGLSACVVHVDWDGNLIWQANLAGEGTSIAPTMDGGYIHAGYKEIIPDSPEPGIAFVTEGFDNEYYGLVFRYDQDGTMLWGDYVYNADCMYLYSICQLAQGGYIAAGNTTNGTGLLIRYAPETGIEEGASPSSHLLLDAPVPNPSTGSFGISFELPTTTTVDLSVYDLSGRRVVTLVSDTVPVGLHQAVWDPGDAPSGCYLLVLRTEDETLTQTCVLMR